LIGGAIGAVLLLCVCCTTSSFLVLSCGKGIIGDAPNETWCPSLPGTAQATPTKSAPVGSKDNPAPYGKALKSSAGVQVTLTAVQRPLPVQDIEVPEEQELVLVSVKIQNTKTTGANADISPENFQLLGADNQTYNANPEGVTTDNLLVKSSLAPSQEVEGDLVFFVYKDDKDLVLAWDTGKGKTLYFALKKGK
jgi:hypothetical protein